MPMYLQPSCICGMHDMECQCLTSVPPEAVELSQSALLAHLLRIALFGQGQHLRRLGLGFAQQSSSRCDWHCPWVCPWLPELMALWPPAWKSARSLSSGGRLLCVAQTWRLLEPWSLQIATSILMQTAHSTARSEPIMQRKDHVCPQEPGGNSASQAVLPTFASEAWRQGLQA